MGKDTISNMITSIRNANLGKIKTIKVPATNITRNIAKILFQDINLKMVIYMKEL